MKYWTEFFDSPVAVIGFGLFVLVFPVYHACLQPLRVRFARFATGKRFQVWRESWVRRILEQGDVTMGVQQMRNTTMVASLLASSTLIMIGLAGNLVFQLSRPQGAKLTASLTPAVFKGVLMIAMLALAFSLFVACLRRLGQFTITIGANPKVMDQTVGSAVGYLTALYGRANRAYSVGIRCLFSLFPLALWFVNDWLFLLMTLALGIRFVFIEDFAYLFKRRKRPLPDGQGSIFQRHNF